MTDQDSGELLRELREYLRKQSEANTRISSLIQQEIPAIRLQLAQFNSDAQRWRSMLDGNGHDGLVTRVRLLSREIKEVRDSVASLARSQEQKSERRWQVWLALIAAVFSLAMVVLERLA